MLSIISGAIVTAAGGVGLWVFKPHNGQMHRLARAPFLDSLIPIAIVSALAVGVAIIISGLGIQ